MTLNRNILLLGALALLGACGDNAKEQAVSPPLEPTGDLSATEVPSGDGAHALYARSCATCHGATAEGVGDYPSLAKLSKETVQARLEAYRAGKAVGSRTPIMAPIVKNLSDEQITALATYLGN